MRILLTTLVLLALVAPAAADEAAPELLVMPDLDAETGARVRFGLATLDNVNGSDRSAHAAFVTALRGSYAVHEDVELSLAVSGAVLAYTNRDGIIGSSTDGGVGLPAFGVEWTRPVSARLRVGAGALAAVGGVDRSMEYDPHPGDVAAGAFFADPEVVWTQAHMGLVHGGVGWTDGETTYHADLGLQAYAGGVLPEAVSILRLWGGLAHKASDRWTVTLEVLVASDLHHEGLADDTDVIPAATAGLRRTGRWDLGLGVSRAWTQVDGGAAEAGFSFLVDLGRRY